MGRELIVNLYIYIYTYTYTYRFFSRKGKPQVVRKRIMALLVINTTYWLSLHLVISIENN